MRSTAFDTSSASSIVSASAYTRTTFSVPDGLLLAPPPRPYLTKLLPFGTFFTTSSIAGWIVAGATQRVSSSLQWMIVRSSTLITEFTLPVSPHTHTHQGRLVYSPLNASMSMCSVIITASRNSASLSASPTAWFTSTDAQMRRWRASRWASYASRRGDASTVSADSSISRRRFTNASLNSTVPWPFASKYRPTSYDDASGCRCFTYASRRARTPTPVFASTTGMPCSLAYRFEAPLA